MKKKETGTPADDSRKITTAEWLAEAVAQFGVDPRQWKFVCPNCKHVQTMADFIELRKHGIEIKDAQAAYFSCIGRFDTRIDPSKVGTLENDLTPCDYTLGGLFPLAKTIVIADDGNETPVFEFDVPEEQTEEDSEEAKDEDERTYEVNPSIRLPIAAEQEGEDKQ